MESFGGSRLSSSAVDFASAADLLPSMDELGSEDEVALIGVDYVCAIAGIDIVAGEPSST